MIRSTQCSLDPKDLKLAFRGNGTGRVENKGKWRGESWWDDMQVVVTSPSQLLCDNASHMLADYLQFECNVNFTIKREVIVNRWE